MLSPERRGEMEFEVDIVTAFAKTFLSRSDFYPRQKNDGGYFVVEKVPHPGVTMAHLKGVITIGAYALSPTNEAKWLCADADTPENWIKLIGMAQALSEQRVPSYLEESRRGGHLWMFTPPTPGKDIRRIGKQLLTEHHIANVELYPKQDKLTTGPGSLVRLPLGIHRVTGKRYSFITPSGEPLAPTIREQVVLLSRAQTVPQSFLDAVLGRVPADPLAVPPSFRKTQATEGTVSERIKAAVSLSHFISQYVKLDAHGRGHCPFHDDSHASFQIHEEKGFWHCYAGCGGGDIIHFWSKIRETHGEDASFVATITELAKMLL